MTRPVTLVTGASAGLGAEFARQCARRGERLALAARRRDRLEALQRTLGGDIHIFEADLARPGAATSLIEQLAAEGLEVATLVNNAGFGLSGRFEAQHPARQAEMIDLNVRALTELCRAVLPAMRARGSGAILNVASTAAFQPGPNMAVYYATKAYVLSLTEALHEELKGSGIRVTVLCPGPTETEFFDVAQVRGGPLRRMAGDAASVVREGLAGLDRGRAIVIPGRRNKVGAQAHRFVPRAAMRRFMARLKAD
ncbi:SDR family oxidoreductase [Sphingosinicella sp. YJ22]|uniref:SDR family NAD(P)-dependent oxidoreductase n=1 Tax=Sphingosinicella sp. YJ22 TaxID=1104780 RepID=UPI00140C871C|nr:SDR family oxidoreductase [Sphingosinicella sp. YJ22]